MNKEVSFEFLFGENPHDEKTTLLVSCIAMQQKAGFKNVLDVRQFECPDCKSPGFNGGWGAFLFTCGAELVGDDDLSGCSRATAVQEPQP